MAKQKQIERAQALRAEIMVLERAKVKREVVKTKERGFQAEDGCGGGVGVLGVDTSTDWVWD